MYYEYYISNYYKNNIIKNFFFFLINKIKFFLVFDVNSVNCL